MLRAGELNQRITLQSPVENHHGGEVVTVWTDEATVWAKVQPAGSRSYTHAEQLQGDTTHLVTIRYRSDLAIKSAWRIQLGSRLLQIEGPPRNVDEAGAATVLECRELEEVA